MALFKKKNKRAWETLIHDTKDGRSNYGIYNIETGKVKIILEIDNDEITTLYQCEDNNKETK